MELTCTVQTLKDGTAGVDADDYPGARGALAAAAARGRRRGGNADDGDGEGAVRGPLKNFRAGSSAGGGRRGRRGRKSKGRRGGNGDADDSDYSGERSSADDDSEGSKVWGKLIARSCGRGEEGER